MLLAAMRRGCGSRWVLVVMSELSDSSCEVEESDLAVLVTGCSLGSGRAGGWMVRVLEMVIGRGG